jgi:hypothetical protein
MLRITTGPFSCMEQKHEHGQTYHKTKSSSEGKPRGEQEMEKLEKIKGEYRTFKDKLVNNKIRWYEHILGTNKDAVPKV